MTGTPVISLRAVDFYYADNKVLDALTLAVRDGDRVALVGENGSGKSTLLRLIAGGLDIDAGTLDVGKDAELLAQETVFAPSTTVADVVQSALAPVMALEGRLNDAAARLAACQEASSEAVSDSAASSEAALGSAVSVGPASDDAWQQTQQDYDVALADAEHADVWNAVRRAERVLAGLDLRDIDQARRLAELSGGQVRRLALAAMLIRRPRIMLLDEPTNHVDDAGLEFLQDMLSKFPGAVVLSSHDREFLDATATAIFDLDPFEAAMRERARGRRGGTSGFASQQGSAFSDEKNLSDSDAGGYFDERLYRGNYSDYLREKRQERTAWEARFTQEQQEISHLSTQGAAKARDIKHRDIRDNNKMGYGKRGNRVEQQVSRRVRAAEHKLEQLVDQQVAKPPLLLSLAASSLGAAQGSDSGAASGAAPAPIIKLQAAGIEGRLRPLDLVVHRGEKLLITGANGSGKSTLLGLLAGDLRATGGKVLRIKGLHVALLEQEVGLQDDERTPREIYELVTQQLPNAADILDYGLLRPEDVDKPLKHLSAGIRRRLILQLQIVQTPDVLLLDEPTNHLSLTLIEELTAAIADTQIAVVVATHDRWMRSTWPKKGRKLHLAGEKPGR